MVKCSPDKNAFINKTSDETALMIAAKNGCKNIVENLLQNNANVNAKTTNVYITLCIPNIDISDSNSPPLATQ